MKAKSLITTQLRIIHNEYDDTNDAAVWHSKRISRSLDGDVETKLQEKQVVCVQSVRGGFVAPAADQDDRPTVVYKLTGMMDVEVGHRASIVLVNHFNKMLADYAEPVWTSTVLAHDKFTGDFETRHTRYVLDSITH